MNHIEKILQEAMDRGDFDNLPGAGKPLDLRENPYVPQDWQMAYRMLASSGFAPDIVEEDKAIRARIAELDTGLQRFIRRWDAMSAEARRTNTTARDTFLRDYLGTIGEINGRIHAFNAIAPRAMNRGTLLSATLRQAAEARLAVD